MKHTLTVPRVDLSTLRSLEARRRPVNSQSSRLKDLATLFIEQFKKQEPALMLHQSDTQFQESYSVTVGEYELKLQILSYNEKDLTPSLVRHAESVLQVNKLRNSLASFSPSEHICVHEAVYEMPYKSFVMCGSTASFQTDIDDGLWAMMFCDRKNRTSACLEITHVSLSEEKPAAVARRR